METEDDIDIAAQFFAQYIRGGNQSRAKLRRWARHKLREDTKATAELMLAEGYRASYVNYFIQHIPRALLYNAGDAVSTVLADVLHAAKQLQQPHRDLAMVCFKYGFPLRSVVTAITKELNKEKGEEE